MSKIKLNKVSIVMGSQSDFKTMRLCQNILKTLGIKTDHIAIRTSYEGLSDYNETIDHPDRKIHVHGTQYLLENCRLRCPNTYCFSGVAAHKQDSHVFDVL